MAAQLRGLGSHPKGSASAPEPDFVSTSTRSTTGVATPACGPSRKGSSRAPRRLVKALQRDGAPLDDEGQFIFGAAPTVIPFEQFDRLDDPQVLLRTSSGSTTGSLATQPRRSGPQKSCARARSSSCSMTTAWRTTNARLRSLTSTSSSPTSSASPATRSPPASRAARPATGSCRTSPRPCRTSPSCATRSASATDAPPPVRLSPDMRGWPPTLPALSSDFTLATWHERKKQK